MAVSLILLYEKVMVDNIMFGIMHNDIIKNYKRHLEFLGFKIYNNGKFDLPNGWKIKKNNYSPYAVKFLDENDEIMFYVNFYVLLYKNNNKSDASISWNVHRKHKL